MTKKDFCKYVLQKPNVKFKIFFKDFVRKVIFLEAMLVFLALLLKNYIRFLISFHFASFACSKNCENRKNIAYDVFFYH